MKMVFTTILKYLEIILFELVNNSFFKESVPFNKLLSSTTYIEKTYFTSLAVHISNLMPELKTIVKSSSEQYKK